MKFLFILCVLILTQWNAFSLDCSLTFDNKEPAYIVEQMEKIHSMDIEQGLLCFSMLKTFFIERTPEPALTSETNEEDRQYINDLLLYENDRRENLERIEYLMSFLLENPIDFTNINPQIHPTIQKKDLFLIKSLLLK